MVFVVEILVTKSQCGVRNMSMLFRRILKAEREDGAWGIMANDRVVV
jgi:hypothetical protein